jgi:S-DNA-T family DNA segregation ATPase FtsK/SpoIIIE
MGWEFRRSAPSDNVMVPATSDPFESPKWAPPVWHMPPVLVLLVNLVRGLIRLLVFAARHPLAVSVASGLGWITYVAGWRPLACLTGLVALVLCGWAWCFWASFLRLVARPVRARWRYLMVYRRNWRPVMVMSGLAFYRNAREYLPTILRVQVTATTDRVLVKMLSGQPPSIWQDHVDNLAHGFGSVTCRIRTAKRPDGRWRGRAGRTGLAMCGWSSYALTPWANRCRACPWPPPSMRLIFPGCPSDDARTPHPGCCACSAHTS